MNLTHIIFYRELIAVHVDDDNGVKEYAVLWEVSLCSIYVVLCRYCIRVVRVQSVDGTIKAKSVLQSPIIVTVIIVLGR